MNEYGTLLQEHMRTFQPTRYSEIPEQRREEFFDAQGREIEAEIADLAEALAGPDLPAETYIEKLGRLNAAKMQARERVLAERVLLPAEPGSPMDETESYVRTG